jgi:uncharacterized protein DUF3800
VSLYVSWSDESSVDNGKGPFVIAGVVGDNDCWPQFSKQWVEEVLEPAPTIPYLHVVEIRSKAFREKYGLTWDDATEKVRQAVRVICAASPLQIYMGSLPEAAYTALKEKVVAAGAKIGRHSEYADYPCFVGYAFAVLNQTGHDVPDLRKVNFVVSRKKYVSHYLQEEVRETLIRFFTDAQPHIAGVVGDVIPLSPEDHPPLQAADVVCWHLNRAYSGNEEDVRDNIKALSDKGIVGIPYDLSLMEKLEDGLLRRIKEKQDDEEL